MGVKIPPVPPSTKDEFEIIKAFLSYHPQYKQADTQRLCQIFKAKSDEINTFPRLPIMIGPSLKR